MTQFSYTAKQNVLAAQWAGENLEDMYAVLKGVVEEDYDGTPQVYCDYIEPYFLNSLGSRSGYFVLKFYAGDDMEVDPGNWVVVYEDGEIEIMDDTQFHKMFEKS